MASDSVSVSKSDNASKAEPWEAEEDVYLLKMKDTSPYKLDYVWKNIAALGILHVLSVYAVFLIPRAKVETIYFAYVLLWVGTLGVQTGAHRLWAHRTYKANFPLRLMLSLFHVLALQNDLYEWCRDHRGHHKWSDTDADPHNSTRGFFFSHMGWLLVRKHPEVIRRGKTIDLSDLEADPIVMFQRRYYIPMVILIWGLFPASVPVYFWGEKWTYSILGCVVLRYVVSLQLTWLVNSAAHLYGNRPYDTTIAPVEANLRNWLVGEGFHNYHHTFPWDYSASEFGAWDLFNPATAFINFFAAIGWAWDLKKASPSMIEKKYNTTGDISVRYEKGHTWREYRQGLFTVTLPLTLALAIHYIFNLKFT